MSLAREARSLQVFDACDDSTTYAQPTIDDYSERTGKIVAAQRAWRGSSEAKGPSSPTASCKLVAIKEPLCLAAGAGLASRDRREHAARSEFSPPRAVRHPWDYMPEGA